MLNDHRESGDGFPAFQPPTADSRDKLHQVRYTLRAGHTKAVQVLYKFNSDSRELGQSEHIRVWKKEQISQPTQQPSCKSESATD